MQHVWNIQMCKRGTCLHYPPHSHLVHVPLTSILENGTPFVMVDILIFSSEISFLSFFTSSTVWHLFCITWSLNYTSVWAENFPQFPDPLSYELAGVAFPDLLFHTEPSLLESCSSPGNSFDTNTYDRMRVVEIPIDWEALLPSSFLPQVPHPCPQAPARGQYVTPIWFDTTKSYLISLVVSKVLT